MVRSLHAALAATLLVSSAFGQTAPDVSRRVDVFHDSGDVANNAADPALASVPAVVWSQIVHVPNSAWVRLSYRHAALSGHAGRGADGSYLRLTSIRDGALQTQHAEHVDQWRRTSAYFNGDAVRVEIVAFPGTGASRLIIDEVLAGPTVSPDSICGSTDDRQLSSDPRAARNQPTGCTSWMINDCGRCFLTAGHCTGNLQVVQFNVPLSTSSGSLQHPPPSDQYAVDAVSLQSNGGQGVGNDWAYFGVFQNSTTGLTPYQANGGQAFNLALPPPVSGQSIRITGYGTTSSPVSPTWNQAQKTHVGAFVTSSGTTVQYRTDTTGGNSGSPVIHENTGDAIGIHTHGGCNSGGGQNSGTGANHSALQSALNNPLGICGCPDLTFDYPNGLPSTLVPNQSTTVRVVVVSGGVSPQPGTGNVFYDVGTGFQSAAMAQVAPNVYDATLPAAPCGSRVRYYFTADDTGGTTYSDPSNAPSETHEADVRLGTATFLAYDFNTAPPGWSVQNTALTTGPWQRGVPINGGRGDPANDFDGSGQCWVTGNAVDEDVDGGPTVLTTQVFDLTATNDPRVRYARWFTNDDGDDAFVAEVSGNGGGTWRTLESVGDSSGWVVAEFRILDFVTALNQVQFRFSVSDNPNNSVTEGGLDAFEITSTVCDVASYSTYGSGCAGSNGVVNLAPLLGQTPQAGSSFSVFFSNLPANTNVFGMLGFSDSVFPPYTLPLSLDFLGMIGCTLDTDIATTTPMVAAGTGLTWTLPIPNGAAFLGIEFFQQAFVLDPGANAFGATTSIAGAGVIGL